MNLFNWNYMKTLRTIKNKCRCGEVANGIVEEKDKTILRIVASDCKKCGLRYVADDMRGTLTPSFQSSIRKII